MRKIKFLIIFLFIFISSIFLSAETFYVSYFNNSKDTIVKIVASPAGQGRWNVLYQGEMGSYGTAKLTGSGEYGDWDFKAITSGGEAYIITINPWLRQNISTAEMQLAGNEDSEDGDEEEEVEYSIRFKNLTGKTLVSLAVAPHGAGDPQTIELNNIANNQSGNIKFNGPEGVEDWDVAVIAKDGSIYMKENVDIKILLKFTPDDYIETEPDSGDAYEEY